MNIIQPLKGTRDFYPEDMALRTWLYETIRRVSESFGYQEYDAPYLEPIELYAAKSGEELVKEQSFVFPDRGGDMITLRPELTPSLTRMIAQRQRQMIYPQRWWSWGPFWRYERPQKGRTREFFQWNIDLIGVQSPEADAELIAVAATFFREVGLPPEEITILVNDRRLMNKVFSDLGIPEEQRPEVSRLVDRRDKMSPIEWENYATEIGLSQEQFTGLKANLENEQLWQESEQLTQVFEALESMGVRDYVRFAPYIVRGLLYYTGTVFEAWDKDSEFRAILGGGRYDNLVEDVGGDPLPQVGFAMGDVVVGLVLEKFGRLPQNRDISPAPVLVTVFDENTMPASISLAAELRQAGLKVALYPEQARLGKQFKYADRMGMRVATILGPDEQAKGLVAVKDLVTGEQVTVPRQEVADKIRKTLESQPPS
ncbi:MAG: histidine--tRNA ligase [Anaerolineales bacterium]|jgi:histidyl-tRNA synthetase